MNFLYIIENIFKMTPRGIRAREFLKYSANSNIELDILSGALRDTGNMKDILAPGTKRLYFAFHDPITTLLNPDLNAMKESHYNKKKLFERQLVRQPSLLQKMAPYIKRNLFPDSYIFCVFGLVKQAINILSQRHYDAVITSAAPFSTFFVGWYLKKKYPRIVWVNDLGDPWSFNPLLLWAKGVRKPFTYAVEKFLLKELDGLIVTTQATQDLYLNYFAGGNRRFKTVVIPPGINERQYIKAREEIQKYSNSKGDSGHIHFVYTGQFSDNIREPFAFYRALEKVPSHVLKQLRIDIYGNIPYRFRPPSSNFAASEVMRYHGTVQDLQIPLIQSSADVLLLFGNNSSIQLPSKVFEYAAARKPILCITPGDFDITGHFIIKNSLGWTVPNSEECISLFLSKLVLERLYKTPLKPSIDFQEISWEARFFALCNFLTDLCQQSP